MLNNKEVGEYFSLFLELNDAKKKFERGYFSWWGGEFNYDRVISYKYVIDTSLVWARTEDGCTYWSNLNNKWQEVFDKLTPQD